MAQARGDRNVGIKGRAVRALGFFAYTRALQT
jgi:hypothetical protein